MKMPKAEYKVPGGKLVRVDVQIKHSKIVGIKISGDFFLHPEEDIKLIENSVLNMPLDEKELSKKIDEILKTRNIECVGVDAGAFARVIMRATELNHPAENKK